MKYTDFDMKMMALGEIAAQLIALLIAVTGWVCLGDMPLLVRTPIAFVILLVVAKMALGFVHIGYKPESREEA